MQSKLTYIFLSNVGFSFNQRFPHFGETRPSELSWVITLKPLHCHDPYIAVQKDSIGAVGK